MPIDKTMDLYYDESSPTFLRRSRDVLGGRGYKITVAKAGSVAGNFNSDGYVHVRVNGKTVKGHVVVWELFNGAVPDGYEVDHLDRNSSNNSIDNLRIVPHNVNTRNRQRSRRNSSGKTGVCLITNVRTLHDYYVGFCTGLEGRRLSKSFSVSRYGVMEAFKLAVIWRKSKIEELNLNGAGYTEGHGNDRCIH